MYSPNLPALFLDRDDTLIQDHGYIHDPAQVHLLPGVAHALQAAWHAFHLYLVTNQSGIGRGYYTLQDAVDCNQKTRSLLQLPVPDFQGICIAPEAPNQPSQYRKPSPQYLLERIQADHLNPQACFAIGDKLSDIQCGVHAGTQSILVAAAQSAFRPDALAFALDHQIPVFASLPDAIHYLLNSQNFQPFR